jgi:hypothetical protein
MQEAKRRRELGDPKAPQKAVPKPKAVAAVSSVPLNMALPTFVPTASAAVEAPVAKRTIKKAASASPVTAPAPAPTFTMPAFTLPFNIPSMPAATPAIAEEEEEESLEEIEIDGKLYAMSSKNECWLMTEEGDRGAWAGIYNPATNTIEESEEPDY